MKSQLTYRMKRKASTHEWVVATYVDGKRNHAADYFTDSKADALATMARLEALEKPSLGVLHGPAAEMLSPGWKRINAVKAQVAS